MCENYWKYFSSPFPCYKVVLSHRKCLESISPISKNFGAEMLSPIKQSKSVAFFKISKSDHHFRFKHNKAIPLHFFTFNFEAKKFRHASIRVRLLFKQFLAQWAPSVTKMLLTQPFLKNFKQFFFQNVKFYQMYVFM